MAVSDPKSRFLFSATEVDKRRSFYKTLAKRAETQVIDRFDATRSGWEEAGNGNRPGPRKKAKIGIR